MFTKKNNDNMILTITTELLLQVCIIVQNNNKYFIMFDDNAYHKMILFKYNTSFLEKILPYYLPSKQHYILNTLQHITYTSFTTIIRQIYNHYNHHYYTKKKYLSSVPLTVFYIQHYTDIYIKNYSDFKAINNTID